MSRILAFTPDQVCRVTGLSRRQLRYWDATGFFRPQYRDDRPRFARLYSFKDLVGLKTISDLRGQLPLQELRRVGAWLKDRYDEPWANLRFFVLGDKVVFDDGSGSHRIARTEQVVLPILLGEVEAETEAAAARLLERCPDQFGKVVRNRYVQHNAWVLDGTRIPTQAIWDFHEAGYSARKIIEEYPRLTPADIEAAISFEKSRQAMAS